MNRKTEIDPIITEGTVTLKRTSYNKNSYIIRQYYQSTESIAVTAAIKTLN